MCMLHIHFLSYATVVLNSQYDNFLHHRQNNVWLEIFVRRIHFYPLLFNWHFYLQTFFLLIMITYVFAK